MGIFEQFRQYSSQEIQKRYNDLISDVQNYPCMLGALKCEEMLINRFFWGVVT